MHLMTVTEALAIFSVFSEDGKTQPGTCPPHSLSLLLLAKEPLYLSAAGEPLPALWSLASTKLCNSNSICGI